VERRTVYRTAAMASALVAAIGFACSNYGEEDEITPPVRDSGLEDGGDDAGPAGDASDAAVDPACGAGCVGTGRSCDAGACVVTCPPGGAGTCMNTVVCPPGVPCVVDCADLKACEGTSCGDASACTFNCPSRDACRYTSCGSAKTCSYACRNENSCRAISCGMAESCVIDCADAGEACKENIDCPNRADSTCDVRCGTQGCGSNIECCADAGCMVSGNGTAVPVACP
jgi:hypothetical protein